MQSKQAIAIIKDMPRVHDELVFPARGKDTPIAGFSKFKKRLNELSGVPDWGIHDLRRTLATKMAALGVSIDVIEMVLNHQSQKLRGVAGIYNRYQYIDEVRDALQEIADHYDGIFRAM